MGSPWVLARDPIVAITKMQRKVGRNSTLHLQQWEPAPFLPEGVESWLTQVPAVEVPAPRSAGRPMLGMSAAVLKELRCLLDPDSEE